MKSYFGSKILTRIYYPDNINLNKSKYFCTKYNYYLVTQFN